MYSNRLRRIEGVSLPPEMGWARNVFWLYTIRLDSGFGLTADELAHRLTKEGIDTRPVFLPMHLLPMYATRRRFPVSEKLAQTGLSLPSSPMLPEDDVERVCESIRKARLAK